MARYWYRRYKTFRDPKVLGYVTHGIQDASVPHHAAGCCGNWHRAYEAELNSKIESWVIDNGFRNDVKALFDQWNQLDSSPPTGLNAGDFNRVPRRNWRIEWLVTWMALNAYHAYKTVYHNFGGGWSFNEASAKHLTKKATALCMLALYKAGIPERCMSSVV